MIKTSFVSSFMLAGLLACVATGQGPGGSPPGGSSPGSGGGTPAGSGIPVGGHLSIFSVNPVQGGNVKCQARSNGIVLGPLGPAPNHQVTFVQTVDLFDLTNGPHDSDEEQRGPFIPTSDISIPQGATPDVNSAILPKVPGTTYLGGALLWYGYPDINGNLTNPQTLHHKMKIIHTP